MKKTLQFTILFCLGIIVFTAFQVKIHQTDPVYKTGDIIFQHSKSLQTDAILLATHSKFSHVGVIVFKNKQLFVLEASEPIRLTPLNTFIARGERSFFEIKRTKQSLPENPLIQKKLDSLENIYIGKHYDVLFLWTDKNIYCSELVWKLYQKVYDIELCPTRPLKDYDLSNTKVQTALKERYYGKKIPLDEPMVSPQDLYESPLLESVQ